MEQKNEKLSVTPSNVVVSILFAIALLMSFAFLSCLTTINNLQSDSSSMSKLSSLLLTETSIPVLYQLETLFSNVPAFTTLLILLVPPFVFKVFESPLGENRNRNIVILAVSAVAAICALVSSALIQTNSVGMLFKTPLAGILSMLSLISITTLIYFLLVAFVNFLKNRSSSSIKSIVLGIVLGIFLAISFAFLTDLSEGFEVVEDNSGLTVVNGVLQKNLGVNDAESISQASRLGSLAFPVGNALPFTWLLLTLVPWLFTSSCRIANKDNVSLVKPSRRTTPTFICALLISAFIITASAFSQAHTLLALFETPLDVVLSLVSLASLTVLIYLMLMAVFSYIQSYATSKSKSEISESTVDAQTLSTENASDDNSVSADSSQTKSGDASTTNAATISESYQRGLFALPVQLQYLVIFLIVFICWIPYVLAFAPGSAENDITRQLAQFDGLIPLTDHHPVLSTYIYGFIFNIGAAIGGATSGLMFMVLIQSILLAAAATFQIYVVRKFEVPMWVVVLSICFFALLPVFGTFAQFAGKDTLFAALFAVYAGLFVLYMKDAENFSRSIPKMAALIIVAILVGLIRHNGFYAVLLSLPFLIFASRGHLLKRLLPLLLAVIAIPCISTAIIAASGAERGSVAETLSIPIQQIARAHRDVSQELTEEQLEGIATVFEGYEIGVFYDPTISDPVKVLLPNDMDVSEFLSLWASIGVDHPLAYADALGEMIYGYFSVQARPTYGEDWTYFLQTQDVYDWISNADPSTTYNAQMFIKIIRSIPLIGVLNQAGFYTWLLLAMLALLIYIGKARNAIALLPYIVFLLTCVLGPVNGDIRYVFPIIAAIPAVVVYTILHTSTQTCINSEN